MSKLEKNFISQKISDRDETPNEFEKMEQVKAIDINYNYENRKKYCGKCNTEIVSKNDYIIEETNYMCFVWYQCSNCQEVNLLVN